MITFNPEYTTHNNKIIATITSEGTANGYPVRHETRLLGVYSDQASAEAAWDTWSDAQEGSTAPIDQPWQGITLPEVRSVEGGIKAIVDAALSSEGVWYITSNTNDWFVDTEESITADVQANFSNYGLSRPPEEWADAFMEAELADWQLVKAIRDGYGI